MHRNREQDQQAILAALDEMIRAVFNRPQSTHPHAVAVQAADALRQQIVSSVGNRAQVIDFAQATADTLVIVEAAGALDWASLTQTAGEHGVIVVQAHDDAAPAADQFMAAAGHHLFARPGRSVKLPFSAEIAHTTVSHFEQRAYTIRAATLADMPTLLELEAACWADLLQATEAEIAARIETFAAGQRVLEQDGAAIGVIYSQRIANTDLLDQHTFRTVSALHAPDHPVAQLLAVNVLPAMQQYGLGDQLLEFMLQYTPLLPGIAQTTAVTLCRDYPQHAADLTPEQYIRLRDDRGRVVDPILNFHAHHGATIARTVPNYRPVDTANQGNGVLVTYNIFEPRYQAVAESAPTLSSAEITAAVTESIQSILRLDVPLNLTRSLHELGLESLELLELRTLLNRKLGVEVEPTFFFRYSTPAAIIDYFANGESRPNAPRLDVRPVAVGEQMPELPPELEGAIAIVGMSCRLPGGSNSPDQFWDLLVNGTDGVSVVPTDRYNIDDYHGSEAGKIKSRRAGFLDNIDQFDAQFFRITPREATYVDPQQRLLLEVTWEALENAGIAPATLSGRNVGAYIGITNHDYEVMQTRYYPDDTQFGPYFNSGWSFATACGRISYFFNWRGPTISVDTACSSSLVGLHLACQALRSGECETAIAAGVNLLLAPPVSIGFSQANMLSPDGRCKTFDASANGYVRAEGCGVVVLKPLAQAWADNDNVLALVRGTAINNDGASNGLTAPSELAQEEVILRAVADAGIDPLDVTYLEAHGTGTPLGDPIEVEALKAIYGAGRSADNPAILASVKTNIGHAEAAAGVSGLLKIVLAMQNEFVPPHLHFESLNPQINLDGFPTIIPTEGHPWKRNGKPRLAAVSSFGFGGTNSHAILQEAPPRPTVVTSPERTQHLLTLSAKNEKALREMAERYADYLANNTEVALGDVAYTANAGRADLSHRLGVIADSAETAQATLAKFAQDGTGAETAIVNSSQSPPIAYLFTGQGAQAVNMGRELYATQPTFRQWLDRCSDLLEPHLGESLIDLLFPAEGADVESHSQKINQTAFTQPALFAIEYSLAQLWLSWGVEPSVMLGHSVGEYAAACFAGVFSLEDACKLIAARGRLMQALPQNGSMVAALTDEATVLAAMEGCEQVSIASLNGSTNVVISGLTAEIEKAVARLQAQEVRTIPLTVSHAFHSPLMEPMLGEFRAIAESITMQSPQRSFISNLTGELAGDNLASADYWVEHVRAAVRFYDGMTQAQALGYELFLEIGPKPTLLGMGRRCISGDALQWLPSLRTGQSDWQVILNTLRALYLRGAAIDWHGVEGDYARQRLELPTYPFQRQRYWVDVEIGKVQRTQSAPKSGYGMVADGADDRHPLLGDPLELAGASSVYFPVAAQGGGADFLLDHQIFQTAIMPATGFMELALAAGQSHFNSDQLTLRDVGIEQSLILDGGARTVQVVLEPKEDGAQFKIFSRAADSDEAWKLHARGQVAPSDADEPRGLNVMPREPLDVADYYAAFHERGMEYAPLFQAIDGLWRHKGRVLGQIELPEALAETANSFYLHPVLFDAALQTLWAIFPEEATFLPVGFERIDFHRRSDTTLWVQAELRSADDQVVQADLYLTNDDGDAVATISGLTLRKASRAALLRSLKKQLDDWMYQPIWEAQPVGETVDAPGRWLVFADEGGTAAKLVKAMKRAGQRTRVVTAEATYHNGTRPAINPDQGEDYERLWRDVQGKKPYSGVLYFWGLDDASAEQQSVRLMHTIQTLANSGGKGVPLWIVTRGTQAVLEPARGKQALNAGALWGLGRVAALEHPDLRCVRLDLSSEAADNDVDQILAELLSAEQTEDQIAYRNGQRYIERLAHVPRQSAVPEGQYRVQLEKYGVIDDLRLAPMAQRDMAADAVEVEVRASGLNFRDVLNALGMLREYYAEHLGITNAADLEFGFECAGVISAVGADVSGLQVGDEVIAAMAVGSMGSHVVLPARHVIHKPAHLTFSEAATIPLAFLTAYYGLVKLAKLQPGERVLIQAATGGVGQAAVQIAQHIGATVYGTGSQGKWAFLRETGVENIYNSRTLDFADDILAATDGQGVQVVLNSLNGEYIDKSFAALAQGGRFVEIGKIGIWDQAQAQNARPDATYFPFDLGEVANESHTIIGEMLDELMAAFRAGELKPLPLKVYPVQQVVQAYRFMAQAKHIGKVVVSFPAAPQIRPNASYLVTGGLGALGLKIAAWLVGQGAKHLILVGRRGAHSATIREAVQSLQEAGANVVVLKGDVSRREDVERMIMAAPVPLRGVVHAAGVLDDGILVQQSAQRFAKVFAPKVSGAWYLHELTRDITLDFCIYYSSIASLMGSSGQSNYAAANAYLDTLASYRQSLGLPALSVNWGPWADAGMAAELDGLFKTQGIDMIPPEQGMQAMGELLARHATQASVFPVNWSRFLKRANRRKPFFTAFIPADTETKAAAASENGSASVGATLQTLSGADRRAHLQTFLSAEINKVIGFGTDTHIDPTVRLFDLGIDSLMGVELVNRLESTLGYTLRSTLLFDYPTLDALTTYLSEFDQAAA